MSVTFGGLASGLDTNALIDGLLAAEAIPLRRNEAKQTSLAVARDTLGSFLSKVTSVRTAAEALDEESEFASFSATTSGSGVVATNTGTALAGSYTIDVNQLAKETRIQSDTFADPTTALSMAGDLEITVGGSAMISVTIGATDSLADIATAINSSDARVNASIIYDGTNQRLLVRGLDTGSANEVVIAETGTVVTGLSTPSNTYQNAQDAEIVLDGQFTISRSNNKFSDVVPGISIVAKELTTSPLTLTVEADADAQAEKIQSFIDAYNSTISAGHLAAGYGGIAASNKNLSGDSAVRTALDRLGRVVSSPIAGLTGKYNMLASLGVNLTNGGNLELDRSKLQQALEDDPEAVGKVFIGDPQNGVDGVMTQLIDNVKTLTDGKSSVLELRKNVFDEEIDRLKEDAQSIGRRLQSFETRMRKQFTDLEVLISKIQQQGSGLAGFTGFAQQRR